MLDQSHENKTDQNDQIVVITQPPSVNASVIVKHVLDIFKKEILQNPVTSAAAFGLSAGEIVTAIAAPEMFIQGLDDYYEDDVSGASLKFALFAILLRSSRILALLRAKLLVPAGSALGTRLLRESLEAFFNMPKSVPNEAEGETHAIVNQFGATMQPYAISHSLLPVITDILTSLIEVLTINGYMWYRLGKVTLPTTLQLVLYLFPTAPLTFKFVGESTGAYIEELYKGFSHTIVFSRDYVANKLFNQQPAAIKKLMDFLENDFNPRLQNSLQINSNALFVPQFVGEIVLVAQLVWAVQDNLLSADQFILLMFYSLLHTDILGNLSHRVIEGIASLSLFVFLLQYLNKAVKPSDKEFVINPREPAIQLQDVSFSYPQTNKFVFRNASLTINQGETVALIGSNGAGKSTLLDMLFGFINPVAGKVFVAGQDVAKVNHASMLARFAVVPQNAMILRGESSTSSTFSNNINCCANATDEQIIAVMQEVGLPVHFEPTTIINFGFGGPELSGGERQKVMLARALLTIRNKATEYLFFDEGFASLDAEGEENILNLLIAEMAKKRMTTIIITHDLARLQAKGVQFDQVIDIKSLNKVAKDTTNYDVNNRHRFTSPLRTANKVVVEAPVATNDNAEEKKSVPTFKL